jgi:phospholipid/cholesterol/gamma-HCH transport system permease protein
MDQPIIDSSVDANGELLLVPRVPLNHQWVQRLWRDIRQILSRQVTRRLLLDFQHVAAIDSAGLALLHAVGQYCHEHRIQVAYQAVPPAIGRFLHFLETDESAPPKASPAPSLDWVSRLGSLLWRGIKEARELIVFSGSLTTAFFRLCTGVKHFRLHETLYYAQLTGADAMPIVSLISFLMGLIMAFQAAVQLRQFGANIFVADLLSLAFTRELGPFLTAVVLAGRSGSAFAAEIGTMKVNEEIDALTVMGFDITEFLVMPWPDRS